MRYFKLVEITEQDPEYNHEILPLQFDDDICPICGDQLMSTWINDIPDLLMQDWDESENECRIKNMKIYKCIDDKCDQFFISFEDGETIYL